MDAAAVLGVIVRALEKRYPCSAPGCTALSTGLDLLRRRVGQTHCEHSARNAALKAAVVRGIHVGAGGAIEVEVGNADRPDSGAVYMHVGRLRDSDGVFVACSDSHAWLQDAVQKARSSPPAPGK
jgi:hypothetical protein